VLLEAHKKGPVPASEYRPNLAALGGRMTVIGGVLKLGELVPCVYDDFSSLLIGFVSRLVELLARIFKGTLFAAYRAQAEQQCHNYRQQYMSHSDSPLSVVVYPVFAFGNMRAIFATHTRGGSSGRQRCTRPGRR
jgi:hypothetical protein